MLIKTPKEAEKYWFRLFNLSKALKTDVQQWNFIQKEMLDLEQFMRKEGTYQTNEHLNNLLTQHTL